MSIADLVVFFVIFEFCIFPKVILEAWHVVVGSLSRNQDERRVPKVILMLLCGGGALIDNNRGRAACQKKKLYDCTLGYPGEDVATRLL